ncbi:uncharacterized protein LOC116163077 [Photinus pyralis]|uniref:uncharacterized protein LOC116163077 n=1 Tax=Photinus pyralis TaxID=7054 RepID=UPI001267430F|nr:uncharacterized protein LOC116163077 [Photinus pyralis]
MDEAQFQQFMKLLNETQVRLIDSYKVHQATQNIAQQPMGTIVPFESFDPSNEKFNCYIERYENYTAVKNLQNDQKKAQLLNASIGLNHYNSLAAFMGPDNPIKEIGYEDLMKKFREMLAPQRKPVVSQHYFLSIAQKEHQSIAQFVATLRQSLSECEFYTTFEINSESTHRMSYHQPRKSRNTSKQRRYHCSQNRQRGTSESRGNRIDYRALGIDNLCLYCGRSNHRSKDCRIEKRRLKCHSCKKIGHTAKVCTIMENQKNTSTQYFQDEASNQEYGICNLIDLFEISPHQDKYIVIVKINDKPQQFEVDSGPKFTLLGENDYKTLKLKSKIQPTPTVFRSYSDHVIKPKGKVIVNVSYKDKVIENELYIVPSGYKPLLGRNWIRKLQIDLKEIDNETSNSPEYVTVGSIQTPDQLFQEFAPVFEEKIGCMPNVEIQLHLRDNASPIFTRARNVPYALRENVNKELDS